MSTSRHPLLFLASGLSLCVAVCFATYLVSAHFCGQFLAKNTDDLEWLQREFDIPEAGMTRIRDRHLAYTSECSRLCLQIADQQRELGLLVEALTPDHAATEEKLVEIGVLRARCQANMLRHFHRVSEDMPDDQAKRYLDEMRRLTLGDHESLERSMSQQPADAHAHP